MEEQGFLESGRPAGRRWARVLGLAALLASACAGPQSAGPSPATRSASADAGEPTGPAARAGDAGPGEAVGAASPARLAALVAARRKDVVECYEARLKRRPELAGRVTTRLDVASDGRVTGAEVVESTLGDAQVEGCIVAQLRKWRLPLQADEAFELEVPWNLAPAPGAPAAANSPSR